MKSWGIRTRVMLLALLPVVLIAVTLAGYMVYRVSADAEHELHTYGLGLSRQLAAVSAVSVLGSNSGDKDALRNIVSAAIDETHVSAIVIYDADGLPVASRGVQAKLLNPLPSADHPSLIGSDENKLLFAAPIIFQRSDTKDVLLTDRPQSAARNLLERAAPIGWVTLSISRATMQQRKREATFFTLLSTFTVLTLAAVLALVLGRQVTQPILRLQDAVVRIRAGDLEARVKTDSGGDLQRLEEGLNSMAEALGENHAFLHMRISAATAELKQKKNEAECSSIAKSRFLAAASHDLRQPLLALSLFTSDLVREAVTQAQQRLSRQINESVNGISDLLDALLDISRLDMAEVVPHKKALPLDRLFRRLETGFSRLAQGKGLRFRCRPTPFWIRSDPVLLERLLGNLVANAIAYTPAGGVLVAARRDGDGLRIEVRDSGIGIAPEQQQSVFDEFFQVANAGRVPGQGLGLGLAIVGRIARMLDLGIALRSAPGRGSIFSFTLPLVTMPPAQPAKISLDALPGSRPGRLVLRLPETAELAEVAALSARWGVDIAWAESFEAARVTPLEENQAGSTVIVAMLDEFSSTDQTHNTNSGTTLILLGNAGETSLPAHLEHDREAVHILPLPLRPAKLRALLNQLFGSTV